MYAILIACKTEDLPRNNVCLLDEVAWAVVELDRFGIMNMFNARSALVREEDKKDLTHNLEHRRLLPENQKLFVNKAEVMKTIAQLNSYLSGLNRENEGVAECAFICFNDFEYKVMGKDLPNAPWFTTRFDYKSTLLDVAAASGLPENFARSSAMAKLMLLAHQPCMPNYAEGGSERGCIMFTEIGKRK